jgi:hypothetical protein
MEPEEIEEQEGGRREAHRIAVTLIRAYSCSEAYLDSNLELSKFLLETIHTSFDFFCIIC